MILHETIVVAIIHDDDESHLSCWVVDFCIDWCCHEHTTSVPVAANVCWVGVTVGVGVNGGDDVGADTTTTDGFIVTDDVDELDDDDDNDGGGIIVDDAVTDVDVDEVNVVVVAVVLSVDVLSAAAVVSNFSLLPILTDVNDVSGVTDGLSSNWNFF